MDRRWSDRRPVCLRALLHGRGAEGIFAPVLNVGMEGIFVSGGDHYEVGSEVDLSLVFPTEQGDTREYALSCRVVHRQQDGVGLHFCAFHRRLFRELEHLLYAGGDPIERVVPTSHAVR